MAGLDYCFKSNNDFLRYAQDGSDILIQKKYDSDELRQVIANPERYLDNADILKDSRTTKAGITSFADGRKFFIKRYNNKGLLFTLRYLFRKPHAFRAWQAAWILRRWDVPTPATFATMRELTAGCLLKKAYLITDCLEAPVATTDFFPEMAASNELLKRFIFQATSFLVPLHCWGIRHLDFKLSNIYVNKAGEDYQFGLWDLDGIVPTNKPFSIPTRTTDLARLYASFEELAKQTSTDIDMAKVKLYLEEGYRHFGGFDLDEAVLEEQKVYFISKRQRRIAREGS